MNVYYFFIVCKSIYFNLPHVYQSLLKLITFLTVYRNVLNIVFSLVTFIEQFLYRFKSQLIFKTTQFLHFNIFFIASLHMHYSNYGIIFNNFSEVVEIYVTTFRPIPRLDPKIRSNIRNA